MLGIAPVGDRVGYLYIWGIVSKLESRGISLCGWSSVWLLLIFLTVPHSLRPYFRRVQIWRSLKTSDRDQATLRAAQFTIHIQKLFRTLKGNAPTMTPSEIDTLIARWMDTELEKTEALRDSLNYSADDQEFMASLAADKYQDALERNGRNPLYLGPAVDALLQWAGLPPLDHDMRDFKRLCRKLHLAKTAVLGIELERWQGIYRDLENPTVAATAVIAPSESPRFSEVVTRFFKENVRSARTDSQAQSEFKKFLTVIGEDKPIATITKADCRSYKEYILKDRSQTSCIKHLSSLGGVFKWAEQQGFVPEGYNPVRGLPPTKKQARKHVKKRRPFADAELLAVLSSPDFLAQRKSNPTRYWVILLVLFQICRREEASQLLVKDIGESDGIPFMRVTNEGDQQTLKTGEHSKRKLPIHSTLLALGFLEYVRSMKNAGEVRLFPDLKKGANGFGDAVGKYFSRLVTSVGLTDPALVLHSLRHGGITKLHGAGVQTNLVEMLAGHVSQTVNGSVYTHWDSIPLDLPRKGLECLQYPAVLKALEEDRH